MKLLAAKNLLNIILYFKYLILINFTIIYTYQDLYGSILGAAKFLVQTSAVCRNRTVKLLFSSVAKALPPLPFQAITTYKCTVNCVIPTCELSCICFGAGGCVARSLIGRYNK